MSKENVQRMGVVFLWLVIIALIGSCMMGVK